MRLRRTRVGLYNGGPWLPARPGPGRTAAERRCWRPKPPLERLNFFH